MVGEGEGGGVDVVLLEGAIVAWYGRATNFGGVDVPLQGAHTLHSSGIQKNQPEKLSWVSCRRYTVLYIDIAKIGFAIWGLCWYYFKSLWNLGTTQRKNTFHV